LPHPEDMSRPRLAAGCRWAEANGKERTVLFPEGAIVIKGTGRDILEHCDGQRTFAQIVAELQALYTLTDVQKIRKEAGNFLEQLREKRIVDF
jgi:pyrroloquinoline quinone biosynthesis protein D